MLTIVSSTIAPKICYQQHNLPCCLRVRRLPTSNSCWTMSALLIVCHNKQRLYTLPTIIKQYSQDFQKGYLHGCLMAVCMHKIGRLGWGHASWDYFFLIRCSKIASEATLRQKQSIAHSVLHTNFGCLYKNMHLLSRLTSREQQNSRWGDICQKSIKLILMVIFKGVIFVDEHK